MKFTLHQIDRIGRISLDTYQEEGPQNDGFIISVREDEGRYTGPAVVPQTLVRPYWRTLINEVYDSATDRHLWVAYSYGSRVQPDVHKAITQALGNISARSRKQ